MFLITIKIYFELPLVLTGKEKYYLYPSKVSKYHHIFLKILFRYEIRYYFFLFWFLFMKLIYSRIDHGCLIVMVKCLKANSYFNFKILFKNQFDLSQEVVNYYLSYLYYIDCSSAFRETFGPQVIKKISSAYYRITCVKGFMTYGRF